MSVLSQKSFDFLRHSSTVLMVYTLLASFYRPTSSLCITESPAGTFIGAGKLSALNHVPMCSYLGIKYGKAPTGDNRFADPIPAEPLLLPTPVIIDGSLCPQTLKNIPVSLNEDCLILNVYTPDNILQLDRKSQPLKPVIFYIPGGALLFGGSISLLYSADFLVENDVIVVTVNYRLSVTGFLSLGVKECGGNMGLKDQNLAMKWVQKNIQSFGGDPNSVTLMGESAGSWSSYIHTVTPRSRGLFNKLIAQSPIATSFVKNYTQHYSFQYAEHMGYTGDLTDGHAVCQFLKQRTIVELMLGFDTFTDKISQTKVTYDIDYGPFWPVIDGHLGDSSFIPTDIEELTNDAPAYPMIFGQTSKEGAIYFLRLTAKNYTASLLGGPAPSPLSGLTDILDEGIDVVDFLGQLTVSEDNDGTIAHMSDNLEAYIKQIVAKNNETIQPGAVARVRDYYLNQAEANQLTGITDLYQDLAYYNFYDQLEALKASFESGKIYTYEIDYNTIYDPAKLLFYGLKDAPTVTGMPHVEDVFYTFYAPALFPVFLPSDDDKKVIRLYSTIFTNFAKTGNPNGDNLGLPEEWKPITADNRDYLLISATPHIETGGINAKRHEILASAVNSTA